jgi:16S rRNA processing protein RimM
MSAEPTDRSDAPLVELGVIVNVHGIRGELRLLPHNPDSALLAANAELVLLHGDGTRERRRVRSARRHKRFTLLTLDGVDSVDAAKAVIGRRVAIPRAALPPAGDNAVYHADLIGCDVVTPDGARLGRVREMLVTPSNDVCVVRGAGREHLIPMIADVIQEIDLPARRLIVRPLRGLLDDDPSDAQS